MSQVGHPRLITEAPLRPDPATGGLFRGEARTPLDGEITFLIECEAHSFPLEHFCRFARHTPEAPYTFPNLVFAEKAPGLRVGPWPGWRGIPDLPGLTLTIGPATVLLKASFWGDEFDTGTLRFVGTTACRHETSFAIRSPEPRLVPQRARAYRTSSIRAGNHPVSLPHRAPESHPLLLLGPGDIASLTTKIRTSHRFVWQRILTLLGNWELPFEKTPESKTVPGPERLSQEDRVLLAAFAALLEPEGENRERALRAFRDFRRETRRAGYEPLRIDTQAGETLFILSVAYDWLWQFLPADEMQEAKEWLWQVADICWSHLGYERNDYAQAHYLGCGLGLLAFSFLFREDHPRAAEWASHLRGVLDCVFEMIPADGSYPHGMNLWIYETGFLLRWVELIRSATGENLWATRSLHRLSDFRAATLSPDALYGITMGDPQYRVGGDSWCHYLIAARTGSPLAQRLGHTLDTLPHEGVDYRHVPPRRRVYECLFYDPSVPASKELPRTRWFGDIGQLCMRSPTTLFTFRSGPPLGRQRYEHGEYGTYGHSDPANGSFLLYRNGEFTVSGPGPLYRRDTSLHNVITVDGKGQIGDSTVWMPDFIPPDQLLPQPEKRSDGRRVLLTAGLTQSYLPHLGVESLTRSLAVDIDRYILGVDSIRCRTSRLIEWNAHTWGPIHRSADDGTFLFPGRARLSLLAPADAQVSIGQSEFVPAYPNDGTRDSRLVTGVRARETCFIWCYLFTDEPAPRFLVQEPSRFTVQFADHHTVSFDGYWLTPDDFDGHPT